MSVTNDLPTIPGGRAARCPFAPPAEYTDWRAADGLARARLRGGGEVWVVSRYEDIRTALRDARLSAAVNMPSQGIPDGDGPRLLVRMDDPEHAELRRMLNGEFIPRRVQEMHPMIQEVCDRSLAEMTAAGSSADLVEAYALPVSFMVICRLLGVPFSDHGFFHHQSSLVHDTTLPVAEKQAATGALLGYLLELLERREREPGDDVLSRQAERVAAGELSRMDAAMNGLALLVAGHDPTAQMIGLGTLALLRHPEQLERLRDTDDPELVAAAVEELLRYLSIVHEDITRVATEDLTIGGQLVRAGEWIAMNLPAGNWDPAFVDAPDTLDTSRTVRGHLAFGFGVHQCLGQNLARAELRIALPALLRALPGLRLAVPFEEIRFRQEMNTYGVHSLPVAWG